MIDFKLKSLLNFEEVKKFLEETGTPLVAFSIFLTALMMIFDANYIQQGNVYHKITIFLLFFIILFLGFFIFAYSNKYDNFFVRIFGIIVFAFPLFFISFLSESLQRNLTEGGYTILLLVSIILSSFLANFVLRYFQYKIFKNNWLFTFICFILAVGMFFIIKSTAFVKIIVKFIILFVPLSKLPDFFQILFMGLEIGIFIGLVLAPSFVVIRKIFPK